MTRQFERVVHVAASPAAIFARLDDQTHLAEHMERPSAMMGGGRMTYEFDAARGRAVGSHIKMGGTAFGISVSVDEVVVEREPPSRKAWKTVRPTRLIIMSAYEMGFEIRAGEPGSRLRVWIRYELPEGVFGRWLAAPLAALYARWCVDRVATDAAGHFASSSRPQSAAAARPNPP